MEESVKIQKPHRGMLNVILAVLAISTIVGFIQNQWSSGLFEKTGLVRGWDFQQFFIAGKLADQPLYDPGTFQSTQKSHLPIDDQNLVFFPLYPPMTALAFQPLSSLPYLQALGIWWGICIACYCAACWILIQQVDRQNRNLILLVMAGFFPFFVAMRAGQLAPVLLLIAVAGMRFRSGLLLSLLSLKPQFAVGMAVYWLLKREWKLLSGMIAGLAIQLILVATLLGPEIIMEYVKMIPIFRSHADMYDFPDGWVHSMSGLTGRLPHLLLIGLAAAICALGGKKEWRQESSLSILFMLFFTPHLLLYDLLFLIVPIAGLLATGRISMLLVISSSTLALPVWSSADVSLVPVLVLGIILYCHWEAFVIRSRSLIRWIGFEREQGSNQQKVWTN